MAIIGGTEMEEGMDTKRVLRCEDGFTASFCVVTEEKDIVRFTDDAIPDMYDHNYGIITATDAQEALRAIAREIARHKAEGKDFCELRVGSGVNIDRLTGLMPTPEITRYGLFISEKPASLRLRERPGAEVLRVDSMARVDDRAAIELDSYGEGYGRDFCIRKNRRNAEVYIPEGLVDSYICYDEGQAVGKADLFIQDGVAMIEDFDVVSSCRRMGYGTTILRRLVDIAVEQGADTIFMVTDMADTAKEMYEKLGFAYAPGRIQLFFKL